MMCAVMPRDSKKLGWVHRDVKFVAVSSKGRKDEVLYSLHINESFYTASGTT